MKRKLQSRVKKLEVTYKEKQKELAEKEMEPEEVDDIDDGGPEPVDDDDDYEPVIPVLDETGEPPVTEDLVEPVSDTEEEDKAKVQEETADVKEEVADEARDEVKEPEKPKDPTIDNISVEDMDLGSGSEDEGENGGGELYDPSKAGDMTDSTGINQINIPQPGELLQSIIGQQDDNTIQPISGECIHHLFFI